MFRLFLLEARLQAGPRLAGPILERTPVAIREPVQCRSGRLRRPKDVACTQDIFQLFGQKRAREEIGFAPTRRLRHGKIWHSFSGGHEVRVSGRQARLCIFSRCARLPFL